MPDGASRRNRRKPAQERSRALVETILDATADTLRTDGPRRTTTMRIAAQAGVSIGAVYQYFQNKQALYRALAERFFSRLDAAADAVWPLVVAAPPREAVRLIVHGVIARAFVDPELDRILHHVAISRMTLGAVAAFEAKQEARVAALLRARRADLPDPAIDVDLAARLLTRALGGVVSSTCTRDPALANAPRFFEELVRLLESYLGFTGEPG
jgi:AcrR family transcriptional regulator